MDTLAERDQQSATIRRAAKAARDRLGVEYDKDLATRLGMRADWLSGLQNGRINRRDRQLIALISELIPN